MIRRNTDERFETDLAEISRNDSQAETRGRIQGNRVDTVYESKRRTSDALTRPVSPVRLCEFTVDSADPISRP